jgi:hypothetical protein
MLWDTNSLKYTISTLIEVDLIGKRKEVVTNN